jgi:hypothetical protein
VDRVIDDLSKDRQHVFFKRAVLVLEVCELLLRQANGVAHAPQEHLDQLVARVHLSLMQETHQ